MQVLPLSYLKKKKKKKKILLWPCWLSISPKCKFYPCSCTIKGSQIGGQPQMTLVMNFCHQVTRRKLRDPPRCLFGSREQWLRKGCLKERAPGNMTSHKMLKTRHQVESYMKAIGKLTSQHIFKQTLSKNIYLLTIKNQIKNPHWLITSTHLSMILKYIQCTYIISY